MSVLSQRRLSPYSAGSGPGPGDRRIRDPQPAHSFLHPIRIRKQLLPLEGFLMGGGSWRFAKLVEVDEATGKL